MKRLLTIGLLFSLATLLVPAAGQAVPAEPLSVFTSVLPLKYFVERIGGERIAARVMVGPGRSPATYEPTPKQMAALSRTRLYYRIGVPFESVWMDRVAALNPAMAMVDLRQGLPLRQLADHHHDAHDHHHHGFGHDEEPAAMDPHVWTDPNLVQQMAERIAQTLSAVDPAGADHYRANYQAFIRDLTELDRTIRQLLAEVTARRFLVFHPSWGYFAAAYGLQQIAVEAAGKEPGPKALAKLIDQARREQIRVVFVQRQFSRATAATIARAIDGRVVAIDPLAEDYLANMRRTAQAFARSLEGSP